MFRAALALVAILALVSMANRLSKHSAVAAGYHTETLALATEMHKAESAWEAYLAASVQANGSDAAVAALPSLALAAACTAPCYYNGTADFTITGQPTASLASNTPGTTGNDLSYNLNRNNLIKGNTVSVQITAHIFASVGGSQTSRCELLTYRVKAQDPYIEPAGTASCGANVGVALERDSGGCDPGSPLSCDPTGATQTAPTRTTDTAIAPCKDYGGWSCSGGGVSPTPTPRPQDNFVNNTWQNNNAVTGWSTH